MSGKYGGAGSSGPTSPQQARGNAPGHHGSISGVQAGTGLTSDAIDPDALNAILESIKTDPKSIQLASTLIPLRKQLEEFEGDQTQEWTSDPKVQLLTSVVEELASVQTQRLDALAAEEMANFLKAVDAAGPAQQSMIDDERQYRALSRIRDSKRYANDAPDRDIQDGERICSHTTRTRTEMFVARLGDIIFPTNDYPVRITSPDNPNPEEYPGYAAAAQKAMEEAAQKYQQAAAAAQQAGQPAPPPMPQRAPEDVLPISDYAKQAAGKFQSWMFGQFDAMKVREKGRDALSRGARLGLGLWYGPFPDVTRRRVPKQGENGVELDLVVEESNVPGLESRDPFRFFYDLTPKLEESNACYYLQLWTLRQLAEFKEYPNVITPNVDELMEQDKPVIDAKIAACITNRTDGSGMAEPLKDRWAIIEVDRILKPDKLEEVLGIVWDSPDLPLIKMWIGDSKCLKIKLSPLEHDWRPPYYHFGILPKDDTVYWYSVPAMGRSAQKAIDGALNASLLNAAVSAAPIIVANRGQLQPHQGRWRLASGLVFDNLNPDITPANAIASITMESNVEGNLALMDRFAAMFDDDVLYDQIAGGNIAGEEIAASQLAQLVNLRSVFQRKLAANVDDYLVGPFAERMVWWGNLYGDDPDMKGPHVVQPIAATQLVSKDILIQHVQALTQLSDNPRYAGFADDYKLYRANADLLDVPDIDEIIEPREKALSNRAEMQKGQTSPDAVKMADIERQKAKDAADIELAKMKLQIESQTELQRQRTDLLIQSSKERTAFVELMTQKQVDIATIQADLASVGMAEDTKKQVATLDATIKTRLAMLPKETGGGDPHSSLD